MFFSPTGIILVLAISAVLHSAFYSENSIYAQFQRCGSRWFNWTPVHKVIESGYHKVTKATGRPFVVCWWARDYLVMPPKYLHDVRTADGTHLNFFHSISDAFHLHTTVGDLYTARTSQRMIDVVKRGLNPLLPQITPILINEIDYSLEHLLEGGSEWQCVKAMELFAEITHRTATRVLICDDLCRNEDFIKQSMRFTKSIFVTALVIANLYLGVFRCLLAWPISLVHGWYLHKCMNILRPHVEKAIQECTADTKKPNAIYWTISLFPETVDKGHHDRFLKELLHSLWAGSSAPGGMITEVVWQLLINDGAIDALREEAREALSQHGWSEKMLNSLHLQDSFIRETNRLFPTGSMTCVRTVLGQPFQFDDGLILPVGTRFGFPAQAIQHDHDALDNPAEFDGFRFVRRGVDDRSVASGEKQWAASSVDTSYLPFGYGNHVCPGRFFAIRLIKLIITKIILEFDIKWDRKGKDRPTPINIEGQFVPNMQQKIYLKRRQDL
ncbi:cytochrome P450 [Aaosphaeria arxii CBS 175.79]|uniref:Cytochrome P450 n=1 Tax=Aaosphaeria arxii CBS 175.79 TaxID=1450172 RepID=A0A6A5XNI6_9PLEO|nr:cytochrome P450 [Aaosphaeria arxii CBS 175.79]KAF2014407.1 cytochrome P450 [Aaosphaeria arxii CBS 175.79]